MRSYIESKHQKPLYIIYSALSVVILTLLFINNTFAEDLNYSVSVEPALNITTSSSKVSLDLNPLAKPFDSQNLQVSVSTNNETGYKLYVNTSTTDLVEKNDSNLTIKTLDSEVSENDFTVNRWGYKLNTENYLPFKSGTLLNYKYTAIENDTTNLTFAAKVDYETKAGSYSLPLNFQATANPNIRYMQNFTNEDCKILASDNSYTVYDLRDENDYQVRYINGNCWMVQNLRYVGDVVGSISTATTWYLKSATSNINANKILTIGATGTESVDVAAIHNSGNATKGVWYNYVAATAGTITGSSNRNDATYDICPKNWHLPSQSEFSSILSHMSSFFNNGPAITGGYYGATGPHLTSYGSWISATYYNSNGNEISRYRLYYNGNNLSLYSYTRNYEIYIRCVRLN